MSAPKKPLERAARTGRTHNTTAGGRPLPDNLPPAPRIVGQAAPTPPAELTGRGKREWEKIWRAGYWLHDDQDYHWIEIICHAYEDIETFRDQINKDGLVQKGYAGQMVAHPLIKEIRDAERVVMKALSTLGFSPSDRARLNLVEAQTKGALADLIAKSRGNQ